MTKNNSDVFGRRFVLKAAGASIALPFLESLAGAEAGSLGKGFQESSRSISSSRLGGVGVPTSSSGIPKRLVFIPMGYGVNAENWFPSGKGKDYKLAPAVKPFESVRDDISFIQNLSFPRSRNAHGATRDFLTTVVDGKGENLGSCDQIAANLLGKDTRLNYLTMGRLGRADGHGALPSFTTDGKPAGGYSDVRTLYKALFGDGQSSNEVIHRLAREKSSLDAVVSEARKLASQVSYEDRGRIEEYFTSVRSIEKRLEKAVEYAGKPLPVAPFEENELGKNGKLISLVFDMMVVAIQSDSTRVLSYALPTQNVISLHPHRMSHKASGAWVEGKLTPHQQRDLAFSKEVARFILKLKETKEGDGSSLLDHSLVSYGTSLRQGHRFGNGPMILAGHGGGGIKQGQNVFTKNKSLGSLWLSMLRHVGVETNQFGNSNGVISEMGFS